MFLLKSHRPLTLSTLKGQHRDAVLADGTQVHLGALTGVEVVALNASNQVVSGYTDSGAMFLAMERGEVNGRTVDLSTVRTFRSDWLKPDGAMRVLLQFARVTRHPDFPDVPTARELAPSDAARALIARVGNARMGLRSADSTSSPSAPSAAQSLEPRSCRRRCDISPSRSDP